MSRPAGPRATSSSGSAQADPVTAVADGPDLGASTIAAVSRRLIPFLFLLFVVNFLDR